MGIFGRVAASVLAAPGDGPNRGYVRAVVLSIAMALTLPVTRLLDGVLADDRDLTEMVFVRDGG